MSTFKEAIQSGLEEYWQALQRAIAGLTPTEVRCNPHPTPITFHMCIMLPAYEGARD